MRLEEAQKLLDDIFEPGRLYYEDLCRICRNFGPNYRALDNWRQSLKTQEEMEKKVGSVFAKLEK